MPLVCMSGTATKALVTGKKISFGLQSVNETAFLELLKGASVVTVVCALSQCACTTNERCAVFPLNLWACVFVCFSGRKEKVRPDIQAVLHIPGQLPWQACQEENTNHCCQPKWSHRGTVGHTV